jgi:hypothetical protein
MLILVFSGLAVAQLL